MCSPLLSHSLTNSPLTHLVRIVLIHCIGVSCHAQQHCCLTTFASLFRVTFMTIRTDVNKSCTVNNRSPSFVFSLLKHLLTQHSLLLSHVFKIHQHTPCTVPSVHSPFSVYFATVVIILLRFFFYTTFISADICTLPASISFSFSQHLKKKTHGADSCVRTSYLVRNLSSHHHLPVLQSP